LIKLSVIAPVYNEEDNIIALYHSITEAVEKKVESYEIILVNDGSRDRSAKILNELAGSDQAVKVVHFEKNCGQTAAIWAGMKKSVGELIAIIDADLQTDPRDIFKLMPYIKKFDFVNGKRIDRKDTLLKKVSSKVGNAVRNWLTGDKIYDTGCPMKLMKREVADSYYLYNGMLSKYGVLNRAFVGLMDAIVIGWLRKRVIHYQVKGE